MEAMRYIGDDGQYHQIPIKLSEKGGAELQRIIVDQKKRKMNYGALFKKQESDAKNRI
jgi:hypothetical protein